MDGGGGGGHTSVNSEHNTQAYSVCVMAREPSCFDGVDTDVMIGLGVSS